jgi:hypothetical protein
MEQLLQLRQGCIAASKPLDGDKSCAVERSRSARRILLCRSLYGALYCPFVLAIHQNASWSVDKGILLTM